jgi:hypothetical protein
MEWGWPAVEETLEIYMYTCRGRYDHFAAWKATDLQHNTKVDA